MYMNIKLKSGSSALARSEQFLSIHAVYADLIRNFDMNHSKVYASLLSGEPKDAKQIARESGVRISKIYKILAELYNLDMIGSVNTAPRSYFIHDPYKTLSKFTKKAQADLQAKKDSLKALISSCAEEVEGEYLLRVTQEQTKLIDQRTKRPVKDEAEFRLIKRKIEEAMVEAPGKRVVVYR